MRGVILILFSIFSSQLVKAQFLSARIRVDGLTCSACSYATQKSLLELDFIDSVQMDLNSNIAAVRFKPNKKTDIHQLAQKVVDAGFSVGMLSAEFNFNSIKLDDSHCFDYAGDLYHIEGAQELTVDGKKTLLFIGKKYMSRTEQKKRKTAIRDSNCKADEKFSGIIYTVVIQ